MNNAHISTQVDMAIGESRSKGEVAIMTPPTGAKLRGTLECLGFYSNEREKLSTGDYVFRGAGWTVIVKPCK